MTDTKSKIQLAIEHIHAHPNCRTHELAEAIGCEPRQVIPLIDAAIKGGLILSCKVQREGQVPVSEFRLSAASPDGKAPDWRTWNTRNAHLAPKKPTSAAARSIATAYKDTTRNVVTTPAGRGANNAGSRESGTSHAPSPPEVTTVVEPPRPAPKPARAGSDETRRTSPLLLTCNSDGVVTITRRSDPMLDHTLSPDEADDIYTFLNDCKPIWGAA